MMPSGNTAPYPTPPNLKNRKNTLKSQMFVSVCLISINIDLKKKS